MRRHFTITRNSRSVAFYVAVVFMLQVVAPAFQGLMAKPAAGYIDTLCTMYGPVEVFVSLDDDRGQEVPDCFDCAQCLLQCQLNAGAETPLLLPDVRYRPLRAPRPGPLYRAAPAPVYSPFLSRAPPA